MLVLVVGSEAGEAWVTGRALQAEGRARLAVGVCLVAGLGASSQTGCWAGLEVTWGRGQSLSCRTASFLGASERLG